MQLITHLISYFPGRKNTKGNYTNLFQYIAGATREEELYIDNRKSHHTKNKIITAGYVDRTRTGKNIKRKFPTRIHSV